MILAVTCRCLVLQNKKMYEDYKYSNTYFSLKIFGFKTDKVHAAWQYCAWQNEKPGEQIMKFTIFRIVKSENYW